VLHSSFIAVTCNIMLIRICTLTVFYGQAVRKHCLHLVLTSEQNAPVKQVLLGWPQSNVTEA